MWETGEIIFIFSFQSLTDHEIFLVPWSNVCQFLINAYKYYMNKTEEKMMKTEIPVFHQSVSITKKFMSLLSDVVNYFKK